jgi:hypothetical protein
LRFSLPRLRPTASSAQSFCRTKLFSGSTHFADARAIRTRAVTPRPAFDKPALQSFPLNTRL